MPNRIIVVDDEPDILQSVRRGLITSGFRSVTLSDDPHEVVTLFEKGETFDIALIDIIMPSMNGLELLDRIKKASPETECIIITATDDVKSAVTAMRKGAYDYLVKPVEKEELILSIRHALERKQLMKILDIGKGNRLPELVNKDAFRAFVTCDPAILKILREAELHAPTETPILITGESGTGKEVLARAIHRASRRASHKFVPVNMAALTPSLFDSEFFGHAKGAFTGADKDRRGLLAYADKGTLFLDEIGTLPPELQGKLLRVLQDGEYIKIGTNRTQKTDVRFIAATNADLDQMLAKKQFRRDLYYRLKGGWLHLPPLKTRKDDIPLLVKHFLTDLVPTAQKILLDESVLYHLMDYSFPGNVRELRGIVQSSFNLSQGSDIREHHLPGHVRQNKKGQTQTGLHAEQIVPLAQMERSYILKVYSATDGNKSKTARVLGIGLNTLRRKLESYGVS